jgi:signal transduction histidine kinase
MEHLGADPGANAIVGRERRGARRIAWAMIGAIVALQLGHIVLGASTGSLADQGALASVIYDGVTFLCSAVFAAAGLVIVTRQPKNTIGWLLLAIPLTAAAAFFVGDYATEALVTHPASLPFGRLAAWVDRWAIVATLVVFIPLFLLFPNGRLPSRRWRPALWLTIAGPAVAIVSFALTPGRLTGAFADLTSVTVMNPLGINAMAGPLNALTKVGGFACVIAAVLAGASVLARFHVASGETRQQIKWLAFVAAAFAVEFAVTLVGAGLLGQEAIGNVGFFLMFLTLALGIPIACGIAILKYRLYEIDVVINKTIVYGALAAFITAVYVGIVVGVGRLVGEGARPDLLLSIVATAVVAVAFQPVRERIQRVANRLVYGERATPYEVLSEFSERMGATYATEDLLPRMARTLAEGTGAARADVWVKIGTQLRPEATWPGEADPLASVEIAGMPEDLVPVAHHGELLGALSIRKKPGEALTPTEAKLIADLAAQAGLVLRNAGLTEQLLVRLEQLRASRQRLVTAQDEARRKLERNIHDGAQQQLVALAVKANLAEQLMGKDVGRARSLLAQVKTESTEALENLRDLARGIYPPLLADKGLGAALEAQARKSPVAVTVESAGIGRYAQEVEAAVYFCCLEALQNIAKYADANAATVRLSDGAGSLTFEVSDDGRGFDPASTGYGTGLQGMADRLDAIGGSLEVRSAPGEGTTVVGRLPGAQASS